MKNLTVGSPKKVIIMFAIPLMVGNILQQLYNMTDSKIVSMYVDTNALAAVGATAVVSNTLIGFISGITQGFAILIARSFGADKKDELRKYVAGTAVLSFVTALVLTFFGELFIERILRLLNTPLELMEYSVAYVKIIIMGILFCAFYNACANILRAVGDSVGPLICLFVSVVMNIALDILLVMNMRLGIKGAAYATIISQAVAGVACFVLLLKKMKGLLPMGDDWVIGHEMYSSLITSGLAMGLMGCIVNIGTIILQSAINILGTVYVTAHISARRVFDLMMIIIYTIGFAMTTYVSQNLGAGEYNRIKRGMKDAIIIDSLINTVLLITVILFGKSLVGWVASSNAPEFIEPGYKYLVVGVSFAYSLGPLFILRCSLQGLGKKFMPLATSVLELVLKIIFAFFLIPRFGYDGVIFTEPVSWVLMTICLLIAYIRIVKSWDNVMV